MSISHQLYDLYRSLADWRDLPLSLSRRVAVIKSVLFPKLSYVFQMIPLILSKTDLGKIHTAFSLFMWRGKRPRIAYDKLILTWEKGGYGLPDISAFSHAVLFRHISDSMLQRSSFSDYELEAALFSPFSPSALLHVPKNALPRTVSTNIFMETYRSWFAINKRLRRNFVESKFNTFWGNPNFLPGLENSQYRVWKEKGISAIKDIFDPRGEIY